jgi:DNA polymerase I-like protein with 3'-5' exonuclease and polymerase domains
MLALTAIGQALFDDVKGGPVAWLHDEIVLEAAVEHADRAAELLQRAMVDAFVETFPGAPVAGLVKIGQGPSWGEAKA